MASPTGWILAGCCRGPSRSRQALTTLRCRVFLDCPAHAYMLCHSTQKMMALTSFDADKVPTQAEAVGEAELRVTDARGPASADPQASGALATALQALATAKGLFTLSPDDPAAGGEPAKTARQRAWAATTSALGNAAKVLEKLATSTAGGFGASALERRPHHGARETGRTSSPRK
jgi:hypothetical protein